MRSRRTLVAAVLLALATACAAFAAQDARVRLSGTRSATAGAAWRGTLTVRPDPRSRPTVTATLGAARAPVRTRRLAAGRYSLSAQFWRAGTWRLSARIGPTTYGLGTVAVRAAGVRLRAVLGIALAPDGSLLIADDSPRVVRADVATGALTSFAEGGGLVAPTDVAVGPDGAVYVADRNAGGVFRAAAGTVSRLFQYDDPLSVAVDPAGNVFTTGRQNTVVRRDAATGAVSRYAGTGEEGSTGNGGPAAAARLFAPHGIAVDSAANVVVAEVTSIRRIDRTTGVIDALAGNGTRALCREEGPAREVCLTALRVEFEPDGDFWVADPENRRLWRVAGGRARAIDVGFAPYDVAAERAGTVLVADHFGRRVVRYDPVRGAVSQVVPR